MATAEQAQVTETAAESDVVNSIVDAEASVAPRRFFTIPGRDPFDEIEWELRHAHIPGKDGPAFEQKDVEFPKFWSQTATNIVSQKYFRGRMASPERERSVKQMIGRVVDTIGSWGREGGYFAADEEAETFEAELKAILVKQYASFNSPVWFNVGFEPKPQCSACFILSIEDSMESILDWIRREGVIFRGGSGSGVNLSRLRSSKEQLSKGGHASGPVSFMRGADASAGTIKSGGKTRRAAKMVVLDVDHPDIDEFIWCKAKEERKARVLEQAGYDMSLDSPDWSSIQYQNANNSVRVTDAFMEAVIEGKEWNLTARTDGSVVETSDARDLLRQMAEAAWECADPGVQYDTTINSWHTLPNTGRINASNPCSEYMSIDDSACNLASLNLMKFRREDGELDIEAFEHAVDVVFLAQEIAVGYSSYPTPEIDRNAKAFRQLGLGYANLGALLMARGLPYDSDDGRAYAAAITALMTGRAYRKSAESAKRMGPFAGYQPNAAAMTGVIAKHRAAVGNIENTSSVPDDLLAAARRAWDEALEIGEVVGFRNAQATVLAPTGTISFMMDCDTTGVEPDFSLVKSKKLVGGGEITIVNKTVPMALDKLGYAPTEVDEIVAFIDERNTVVGAPNVKTEHYPVFDCAIGDRAISHMGHVKMMGAVQPFISGALSKTVNLPEETTVDEISQLFIESWQLGVKAIAIYRDNCKVAQPLSGKSNAGATTLAPVGAAFAGHPQRRRLPDDRVEVGRKFKVGEYEGYIHVGLFDDGTPGDIFVDIAKEGTTLAGLMNSFMISVSLGLQYGVPLEVYVSKFSHMRFEPSGMTNDADIRVAKSLVDYIFRWMGKKFLSTDQQEEAGILTAEVKQRLAAAYNEAGDHAAAAEIVGAAAPGQTALFNQWEDAVECARCGGRMVRTGSCYTCRDCGTNTGCS
ncbi:MAG: vitamin B12-dependent ribonucleotide reductase [Thermoleophilia bacterium]|nr:vitamin B12-dependent ribonucleotide reductase [Thermoleophilia bacterium]MDH4340295.1 vitamin B12-dependent ribonucleotide reductase [Thermoleophilia bacterium]